MGNTDDQPKDQPKAPTRRCSDTLILFDVDGTLAVPAQPANEEAILMLERLRQDYFVGIVGAGDFEKQQKQLGGGDLRQKLDFVFSENGVHAFRGEQIHCKSIVDFLGEDMWQSFQDKLDRILLAEREEAERLLEVASPSASIADRGTFLERRQCTVNICPIGRTPGLSKEERAAFDAADKESGMRKRILTQCREQFGPDTDYNLTFSIGGQIGIDVCPLGWDKTFCLQFVSEKEFPVVHFFGDNTHEGGGDYEIYEHPRTHGHTVKSPEDTLLQVEELFFDPAGGDEVGNA